MIGQWIQKETWEDVFNGKNSTEMASEFTRVVFEKLDQICPEEELKISKLDGKQTSLALQSLARQRLREYTRNGNSEKFKDIKRKQKSRQRLEAKKELDKAIEDAGEKGTKWMRKAKSMSARPGEDMSPTFSLPQHVDDNLTASQSAEKLVEYFSKISK